MERFDGHQTQVLGLSVDSVPSLNAWAENLGGITYPLLSDFYPHGLTADCYGVLRADGRSERAIFVIDKKGIIQYVDVHDIDEQPDNEVLFGVLAQLEPSAASVERKYVTAPQAEPEGDVVLYCTSWCPQCRAARAYFKEKGIPIVEVDISKNRAAAARVKEWAGGFETTPTIKIKGQVVVGFDRTKLEQLLRG